jgi:hypothetical protein
MRNHARRSGISYAVRNADPNGLVIAHNALVSRDHLHASRDCAVYQGGGWGSQPILLIRRGAGNQRGRRLYQSGGAAWRMNQIAAGK